MIEEEEEKTTTDKAKSKSTYKEQEQESEEVVDRHPEKRMKAAMKKFEEEMMPFLKK